MNFIHILDKKADEALAKVGIKNKDIQNLIEVGGVLTIGYLFYKIFKGKNLVSKTKMMRS